MFLKFSLETIQIFFNFNYHTRGNFVSYEQQIMLVINCHYLCFDLN